MGGGRVSYKLNFSPVGTLVNDTCHSKSPGVESSPALRLTRPFREVLISKGKCSLNLGCAGAPLLARPLRKRRERSRSCCARVGRTLLSANVWITTAPADPSLNCHAERSRVPHVSPPLRDVGVTTTRCHPCHPEQSVPSLPQMNLSSSAKRRACPELVEGTYATGSAQLRLTISNHVGRTLLSANAWITTTYADPPLNLSSCL